MQVLTAWFLSHPNNLGTLVLYYSGHILGKSRTCHRFFFAPMEKLDKQKEIEIREKFANLQNEEDFLNLLNTARSIVYDFSPAPFTMKQLRYYRYSSLSKERYKEFEIKKKSGGVRQIMAPCKTLKYIQKCINFLLQTVFVPSPQAMGFVPQRSIATNAKKHIGQLYVYNMDLKDFFPSIEAGRIYRRMQAQPFNLPDTVASILTDLCCHPMLVERMENGTLVKVLKNVLPQGAPTSPVLTNIICDRLDLHLNKLANSIGVRYTRYADDITFSSMHNIYQDDSEFLVKVRAIINEQGFQINENKTRLQKRGMRQEVTGLVVSNEKINVSKKYVKQLRKLLYCWDRYGEGVVSKILKNTYHDGNAAKVPQIENLIGGKLLFLKMVKGESDSTYQKLLAKYELLTQKNSTENVQGNVGNLEKVDSKQTHSNKSTKIQMHRPIAVVECLRKFRFDGCLKYATHKWDKKEGRCVQSYETIERFKKFESEFQEITEKYNKFLGQLLEKFVLGKVPENGEYEWGLDHIRIGYGYPADFMKDWLSQNRDRQPLSMPLSVFPEELRPHVIDGGTPSYFGDIIDSFKREIEFRGDGLYNMFIDIFDAYPDLKPDWKCLESLKGKELYTSTQSVYSAIDIMFYCFSRNRAQGLIEVTAKEVPLAIDNPSINSCVVIEILNVGSFSNKSVQSEKLNGDGGDFGDIRWNLQSLCDWSVESRFKGKNYRIDYLQAEKPSCINEKGTRVPVDYECRGFKHILKFYNSKNEESYNN